MSKRRVFIGLVLLILFAGCVQQPAETTTTIQDSAIKNTTTTTTTTNTSTTMYDCTKTSVLSECHDTDGTDIYTRGVVTGFFFMPSGNSWNDTDTCIDNETVREYICGNSYAYCHLTHESRDIGCPGGYICRDGACAQSTTTTVKTTDVTHSTPVVSTPPSCRDTDTVVLGNRVTADIYKKGVTYSSGWGHRINPEETDYCMNQTTLMEYTCWTFSDTPIPKKIDCLEGCLDGACVRSATTEADKICFDSDGGIVYGGAGEVEDYDGTAWTKHKDTCLDNGFLIEWYCEYGAAKNTTTKCPATCGYGGMCYTTLQSTWATTTTTLT